MMMLAGSLSTPFSPRMHLNPLIREFLTGFRKRKLQKKEAAKSKAKERERQERLQARKEMRQQLKEQAEKNARMVEGAFGNGSFDFRASSYNNQ